MSEPLYLSGTTPSRRAIEDGRSLLQLDAGTTRREGLFYGIDLRDPNRYLGRGRFDPTSRELPRQLGEAQPFFDQAWRGIKRAAIGIPLTLMETAGHIFDLTSYMGMAGQTSADFSNPFTEMAIRGREWLMDGNDIYHSDPDANIDLADFGWWADHGSGLIDSIAAFYLTGAGVGAVLGRGAAALGGAAKGIAAARAAGAGYNGTQALRSAVALGANVQRGANMAAHGLTAAELAYTEGAMEAGRVYRDTIAEQESLVGREAAEAMAAMAAATTVRYNMTNTLLNLTGIATMFRPYQTARTMRRMGLTPIAGEAPEEFITRIKGIEGVGSQLGRRVGRYIGEAGQESLEEVINEASSRMGMERAKPADERRGFGEIMAETIGSEEGQLAAVLGAIGGVGQTALLRHAPTPEPRTGVMGEDRRGWSSGSARERKGLNEDMVRRRDQIVARATRMKALQDESKRHLETGNAEAYNKAQDELFGEVLMDGLRNGTEDVVASLFNDIANLTDEQAVERGFDPRDMDKTRERARKTSADLRELTRVYDDYRTLYGADPQEDRFGVADRLFKHYVGVKAGTERVAQARKDAAAADKEARDQAHAISHFMDFPELQRLSQIRRDKARQEVAVERERNTDLSSPEAIAIQQAKMEAEGTPVRGAKNVVAGRIRKAQKERLAILEKRLEELKNEEAEEELELEKSGIPIYTIENDYDTAKTQAEMAASNEAQAAVYLKQEKDAHDRLMSRKGRKEYIKERQDELDRILDEHSKIASDEIDHATTPEEVDAAVTKAEVKPEVVAKAETTKGVIKSQKEAQEAEERKRAEEEVLQAEMEEKAQEADTSDTPMTQEEYEADLRELGFDDAFINEERLKFGLPPLPGFETPSPTENKPDPPIVDESKDDEFLAPDKPAPDARVEQTDETPKFDGMVNVQPTSVKQQVFAAPVAEGNTFFASTGLAYVSMEGMDDTNPDNDNLHVLDGPEINPGTELRFIVDPEYKSPSTGRKLYIAETIDPDWVPIRVEALVNGEWVPTGLIHDPSWIESGARWWMKRGKENPKERERQMNALLNLRRNIVVDGHTSGQVRSRSYGHLAKNKDLAPPTQEMKNELPLFIVKGGEADGNNPDLKVIDSPAVDKLLSDKEGKILMIMVPSGVEGRHIPAALQLDPIGPTRATEIYNFLKALHEGNTDLKTWLEDNWGNSDLESIRDGLQAFIHSKSYFNSKDLKRPAPRDTGPEHVFFFLDAKTGGVSIGMRANKDTNRAMGYYSTIAGEEKFGAQDPFAEENREAVIAMLSNHLPNAKLSLLNTSGEVNFPVVAEDGKVGKRKWQSHNDYLWEHIRTNLRRREVGPNGAPSYVYQVVTEVETTAPPAEPTPTPTPTTVVAPTPIEEVDDALIDEFIPDEVDEEVDPTSLDKKLDRLHNSPVRRKGISTSTEAEVKSFLKDLRNAANDPQYKENILIHYTNNPEEADQIVKATLDQIDTGEGFLLEGDYARTTQWLEEALTNIHASTMGVDLPSRMARLLGQMEREQSEAEEVATEETTPTLASTQTDSAVDLAYNAMGAINKLPKALRAIGKPQLLEAVENATGGSASIVYMDADSPRRPIQFHTSKDGLNAPRASILIMAGGDVIILPMQAQEYFFLQWAKVRLNEFGNFEHVPPPGRATPLDFLFGTEVDPNVDLSGTFGTPSLHREPGTPNVFVVDTQEAARKLAEDGKITYACKLS